MAGLLFSRTVRVYEFLGISAAQVHKYRELRWERAYAAALQLHLVSISASLFQIQLLCLHVATQLNIISLSSSCACPVYPGQPYNPIQCGVCEEDSMQCTCSLAASGSGMKCDNMISPTSAGKKGMIHRDCVGSALGTNFMVPNESTLNPHPSTLNHNPKP